METKPKVLITGCKGQLGSDLVAGLSGDYRVHGIDIDELDITDAGQVFSFISGLRPHVVIHAAAYTDVDGCEEHVGEAMAINATGTGHVALACREAGARMIYYSTDYVFDGELDRPYSESDAVAPLNVYGKSKLAGEKTVVQHLDDYAILRTAWVYGPNGRNFVKTMLRAGKEQLASGSGGPAGKPLTVVDDQIGNPTWTMDVVSQTETVLREGLKGLYHASSEGACSWYHLACDVFDIMHMPVDIRPCRTEEFPRPARRPKWSVMANDRLEGLGLNEMPGYRTGLEKFLSEWGTRILDDV